MAAAVVECMPRPRKLSDSVLLAFAIEKKYALLIEEIARMERISKSELLRRIVREWLESEARVRYGLRLLEAEQRRPDAALQLSPLIEKRYRAVEKAWHELAKPLVDAKNQLAQLAPRATQLHDLAAPSSLFGLSHEERERALRELREVEGQLSEAKTRFAELRRQFFKRCYYPFLRIRRDLPEEVRDPLEARIARTLEVIDEAERILGWQR